MSIASATHLEEVDNSAWAKLAAEVGFAPRFLGQRMLPFVRRVADAALGLSVGPEHSRDTAERISDGIFERAVRFGLNAHDFEEHNE